MINCLQHSHKYIFTRSPLRNYLNIFKFKVPSFSNYKNNNKKKAPSLDDTM